MQCAPFKNTWSNISFIISIIIIIIISCTTIIKSYIAENAGFKITTNLMEHLKRIPIKISIRVSMVYNIKREADFSRYFYNSR